ncbi:MAG: hypothetical protein M0D55_13640 [Elusimicrobiota bacterium]|nr:MAG: hypothetical protein M0D55_13640 [Elusimicrobiota bacterium]
MNLETSSSEIGLCKVWHLSKTLSCTMIGQPARTAIAIASEGRLSSRTVFFPSLAWTFA